MGRWMGGYGLRPLSKNIATGYAQARILQLALIVLYVIIVIVSIINSINHFEDKRQKTDGCPYPLPPPLLVLYFYHKLLIYGGWWYLLVIAIGIVC